MFRYTFKFTGREIGSIGSFQEFTITLNGCNKKNAIDGIYATHEHLANIKVLNVENLSNDLREYQAGNNSSMPLDRKYLRTCAVYRMIRQGKITEKHVALECLEEKHGNRYIRATLELWLSNPFKHLPIARSPSNMPEYIKNVSRPTKLELHEWIDYKLQRIMFHEDKHPNSTGIINKLNADVELLEIKIGYTA